MEVQLLLLGSKDLLRLRHDEDDDGVVDRSATFDVVADAVVADAVVAADVAADVVAVALSPWPLGPQLQVIPVNRK